MEEEFEDINFLDQDKLKKQEEKIEEKKTLKLPIWLVILIAFVGGLGLLYASMALSAKMNYNRRMREIRMPINKHKEMMLALENEKSNELNNHLTKLNKDRIDKQTKKAHEYFLRKYSQKLNII